MDYSETLDYLYKRTPAFHLLGSEAYKPGLEVSYKLDDLSDNPHTRYKSIHIAGTNGKGSVAHIIAAVLRASGHKVGLYTSPHLLDFKERIRVNGNTITNQYVIDFVGKHVKFIEREKPSFFALTTALAFDYFRHKKVNYAVIETGLGGRFDCTNIINPVLSIITSISLDHTQILGEDVMSIAKEKAGIIKYNVPVVIGKIDNEKVLQLLVNKASEVSAPAIVASQRNFLTDAYMQQDGSWLFESTDYGRFSCSLRGLSQKINVQTVLAALRTLSNAGVQIRINAVRKAFENVSEMTGLMGRWQQLHDKPKVICDIGHNVGAWHVILRQLYIEAQRHYKLHIIYGASNDKDSEGIFELMPKNATYYLTRSNNPRAVPPEKLASLASEFEFRYKTFRTVTDAIYEATRNADENDLIFIGGSVFVVAEALKAFPDA
jgi:dihydrofolate synthase/folylpolyglutamate synthase